MKVLTTLDSLVAVDKPVVMAAGFFDGVHRGHRKVLDKTIERAFSLKGQSWVLTFDRHPKSVLDPDNAPLLLTSKSHKLSLIEQCHIDGCIVMPFTKDLAAVDPHSFVRKLVDSSPQLKEIVVGENWRFGHNGSGTPSMLAAHGKNHDLSITVVSPAIDNAQPISSTRIRELIISGHMDQASHMLGRPFSIFGTVVHGRKMGRKLGYPTANIDPHNEALPPFGVYAVKAIVQGTTHKALLNHGFRPTFSDHDQNIPLLEIHILDFDQSLYHQDLEVIFVSHLRQEQVFPSPAALQQQLILDEQHARACLE